eukprot:scaffold895_cov315-Pinguiococcus_pyrenoidosus.AAC.76
MERDEREERLWDSLGLFELPQEAGHLAEHVGGARRLAACTIMEHSGVVLDALNVGYSRSSDIQEVLHQFRGRVPMLLEPGEEEVEGVRIHHLLFVGHHLAERSTQDPELGLGSDAEAVDGAPHRDPKAFPGARESPTIGLGGSHVRRSFYANALSVDAAGGNHLDIVAVCCRGARNPEPKLVLLRVGPRQGVKCCIVNFTAPVLAEAAIKPSLEDRAAHQLPEERRLDGTGVANKLSQLFRFPTRYFDVLRQTNGHREEGRGIALHGAMRQVRAALEQFQRVVESHVGKAPHRRGRQKQAARSKGSSARICRLLA